MNSRSQKRRSGAITFDSHLKTSVPRLCLIVAAIFFAASTSAISWWRWFTYQYGTFDLAFYVQGLWLACRGEWHVSLLDVPILGNHAEPIVFLLTPLFAVCPHPMLLVAVQVLALASMPFTAWRIARRLGLGEWEAAALALAAVAVPAAGFVAEHEFHPEAFAAPLLLLAYEARLREKWGWFCLWFAACVGCKENIALLMVAWAVIYSWSERKKDSRWQWRWNFGPGLAAFVWLGFYGLVLSPAINGGNVDYGNLYSHLGDSGGDIVRKFFTEPSRAGHAVWQGLTQGNLVWSLLVSFALLPLLRPSWLVVAAPLVFQHLLSSRSSEWQINFHYAAPFIPLLWIATAEALAGGRLPRAAAFLPLIACLVLQPLIGPFRTVPDDLRTMDAVLVDRDRKAVYVERLAPDHVVCAGLPYLSHLATRRGLYSLHFILKGLKTLGTTHFNDDFTPDDVLLDYGDMQTFNPVARYYHPEGERLGVKLLSSDELLNAFLSRYSWNAFTVNALTLLQRTGPASTEPLEEGGSKINDQSWLLGAAITPMEDAAHYLVRIKWRFTAPRKRIPWVSLRLQGPSAARRILIGMCSPQTGSGAAAENRAVTLPADLPPGSYQAYLEFTDRIEQLWRPETPQTSAVLPLGQIDWPPRRTHEN